MKQSNQQSKRRPQTKVSKCEKNYPKRQTKSREEEALESQEAGNHISWYVPDANMLKDVAQIPFNYRTGDRLPVALRQSATGDTWISDDWVEPGVFVARFVPTYGDLQDAQSPGNVASTAVYSWVRHANSGSRNYDAVDLMLYLLAMDSVYMGITWCQRLIANVMAYSRMNIYPPRAFVEGMGVTWNTSLVGDLPAMRLRLNNMILKATTLAVPRALPIYERHAFMCSNVYADNTEERTQFYIFNPDYLWQFGYDGESKGALSCVKFGSLGLPSANGKSQLVSSSQPWSTYFEVVEALINALYGDEDAGIMSGDILKAYGKESLFELVTLPDDVIAMPLYDGEFLEQIHNGFAVGQWDQTSSISQVLPSPTVTSPYLEATYKFAPIGSTAELINRDRIFDLHMEVNPENIMRATRLTGPCQTGANNELYGVGTEVLTVLGIISMDYTTGNFAMWTANSVPNVAPFDENAWNVSVGLLQFMLKSQTFFRSPVLYPIIGDNSDGGTTKDAAMPLGETSKVTLLTVENRRQLNEVAILGCFNVPRLTLGFVENS